jgi:heme-degrading monooxygenase HmoA
MFARVSTIQGKKDQIDQGINHYREKLLPEAQKMSGFKGAYLLVDRKSGKSVGITLWDTEKDLQSSAAAADKLRTQASKVTNATGLPVVEIYEVTVQSSQH